MDTKFLRAYAEVDAVLNLMDEEFQNKIPPKLKNLIEENKLKDYNVKINPKMPLKEQEISKEALAILAVLDYNYWCTDEEKKEVLKKYASNEREKQERLEKLYNTENLFNRDKLVKKHNVEDNQMVIYDKKENIFTKIKNKIRQMF